MESVVLTTSRASRLPFMDGVRGLAALLIVIWHTKVFWPYEPFRAYLAVDIFFLLSGYVISRAYGLRLSSGALSTGKFMATRLIRLYPMFLLSALWAGAQFLVSTLHHQGTIGAGPAFTVLFMALMLPVNFLGSPALYPLNIPYWSLFFEIAVNNFYALIVQRSVRTIGLIVGVAAVVLMIAALRGHGLDLGFQWNALSFSGGLARATFGILLGALFERHGAKWRATRMLRAHPWVAVTTLFLIMVSPDAGAWNGLVDAIFVLLVLPACVLALDAQPREMLVGRGLMALGAASYPLYVLHIPASAVAQRLGAAWMTTHPMAVGIVYVLGLIATCIALERLADEPLRRRLQKRFLANAHGEGSDKPPERQKALSSLTRDAV